MIRILYKKKANIYQTQLTDFTGAKKVETYEMWVSKDRNYVRKNFLWVSMRYYNKRNNSGESTKSTLIPLKITYFIKWVPKLKGKYLYRFRRVETTRFKDYAEGVISKMEWDMFHYLHKFKGYIEHLFYFNDFSFFDDLQERLESEGVSFKGMFIRDVFAYELFRVNLGTKDYAGLEKLGGFLHAPPLFGVTHDSYFFPTAADLSYVMNRIPANELFAFFQLLVKECIKLGIIIPRILIWDGQFIRSNCNNNKDKEKGEYNDPDAGYCRHNGTKKGVGYDPGILYAYCFDRWFPIYFKMFPGNRNDTRAYRESLDEFLEVTEENWMISIADSGAYSLKNMEFTQNKGLVPIIRARKNIKNQPVKELKKDFYFNTAFIPKEWSIEFFLKIYSFRPMIEEGNSFNNTYYNGSRMNTRGIEAAIKQRATIYILVLLKALTAYKVGRPDLIMTPSSFEASKYFGAYFSKARLAEESGYLIFTPVLELLRHKSKMYRN